MKRMYKMLAFVLAVMMVVGMIPAVTVSALPPQANFDLARTAVGEGIVLLKNEDALPLKSTQTIALFGGGQVFTGSTENGYQIGGGGSGRVYYDDRTIAGPADALLEAADAGKINIYKPLTQAYKADVNYVPDAAMYTAAAAAADTAIMFVNRYSLETEDLTKAEWYLSDAEKAMMKTLSEKFEKVVVVLNTPSAMSTDWSLEGNAYGIDIEGLLTIYMGGEMGAYGLCDILLGDTNPSGKLTDTYAADIDDYLSTDTFLEDNSYVRYTDDIYVGYRYFETFAKDKVVYPFGFGLSYTDFEITAGTVTNDGETVTVPVTVKNVGDVAGKEVVQVYYAAPQAGEGNAKLSKAATNLIAFDKTKLLAAGESETLTLTFKIADMASFDDTGISGHKGSFVLEAGTYDIMVGNNVRAAAKAGEYVLAAAKVTDTPAADLTSTVDKRMTADGSYEVFYEFISDAVPVVKEDEVTIIEAETATLAGSLKTENFNATSGFFNNGTTYVGIPAGTVLGGHDGANGGNSTFALNVEKAGTYTIGFIMGNGDSATNQDLRDLLSISYSADGEHWTTVPVNVDCKHTRNVGTAAAWWNFYYSQADFDGNAYQVTLPKGQAYLRFTTLPAANPIGAINMDKFVLIPEGKTFTIADALIHYGVDEDTTPVIAADELTWIEGESGVLAGNCKTENFTATQGFIHNGTEWLSIGAGTVVGNFDKAIGNGVSYTVNVEKAGTYTLGFVQGNGGGKATGDLKDLLSISVSADGSAWTTAPNNVDCKWTRNVGTGAFYWNLYYSNTDLDGNPYTVTLPKGKVTVKLSNLAAEALGGCINLDKIVFIPEGMTCTTDAAIAHYGVLGLDEENFVGITYADVEAGKATKEAFLAQLSYNQLIDLTYGHTTGVKYGTGSLGFSSNATAEKYGVISADTADGPAGIRSGAFTSTYWPCSTLQACTWNKELVEEIGKKVGGEAIDSFADIWLAPGMNIHRSPLCGRNFEYYSEDPVLTGSIAIAVVKGVQSIGVGCEVKHFAINNKESNRRNSDSRVSEKAMREIYLKGFEMVIKEANPIALMTSYNIINGTQASANAELMQGVLRTEWGFEGIITTDWSTSAVVSHAEEIIAGTTSKMPLDSANVASMEAAVKDGRLSREMLEENAWYLISTLGRCYDYTTKQYTVHTVATEGTTIIPATEFFRKSHQTTFARVDDNTFAGDYMNNQDADGTYGYLDFKINVPVEGVYTLFTTYSRNGGGWDNAYKLLVDGGDTASWSCPVVQTASWNDFRTDEVGKVTLTKGEHIIRFQNGSGGLNVLAVNLTACAHEGAELIVDIAPTCGVVGTGHKNCGTCGYTIENIEIAATGNHKAGDLEVDTAPTCTAEGVGHKDCAVCGQRMESDIVIPITAHEFDLSGWIRSDTHHWRICLNEDCEAEGEKIAHTAGKLIVDTAATCGTAGVGHKECTVCTMPTESNIVIPATGKHSYDKGVITTKPTTEKTGIKTFTCKTCGTTKTETVAKLPKEESKPKVSFTDVKKSDYYYDAVAWAVELGVTTGTSKTTFGPEESCTRAQAVTFLWRAAGSPAPKGSNNPFTDVKKSDYYYKAVLWAVEKNVTTGTSKTTFSPDDACTRGQIVAFLHRAQGGKKVSAANPFTDVKKNDYYYNAVLWAVKNNVTTGTSSTTFSPNDTCTRGQIVTFLYRAVEK